MGEPVLPRPSNSGCGSVSGLLGASFACQLEVGHDGPHQHKDEQGTMTWEPRYAANLRAAVNGAYAALTRENDMGPDTSEEAVEYARDLLAALMVDA